MLGARVMAYVAYIATTSCQFRQERAAKPPYLERVHAREIASLPLVTLTPIAVEIVLYGVTHGVSFRPICRESLLIYKPSHRR
jgi:hypothetical protein